ncbi:MAG TPA: hypothetical protein PLG59_18675 [bacterium]|nr:hypothetical protein [bacterium]HQO36695.1 hypothetical protein [bacterium]HQQ00548.1 hypothetical protein [bacterium]
MRACRIVLILFLLFSMSADADNELRLEVTGSTPAPILALAPPEPGDVPDVAQQIDQILSYDLDFSKRVRLHTDISRVSGQMSQDRTSGTVNYTAWKSIGAEYTVDCRVRSEGTGQVIVDLTIHDIRDGTRLLGKRFTLPRKQLRQGGHLISDVIVQACTLEDGIAQTSFLFVYHNPTARSKEIFQVDYDGYPQSVKPLTKFGTITQFPAWSPNGVSFAFSSFRSGWLDAYIQSLDAGKLFFLAKAPGNNLTPSWFPNNPDWLVISLSYVGNAEIFLLRRDGKQPKRITNHPAIDSSPVVSPNGQEIVFTSDRGGIATLYMMSTEGTNVRRLVPDGGLSCDTAQWSPVPLNGQYRIAFRGYRAGQVRGDIYMIGADGSDMRNLTNGQGDNSNPTWAPDGSYIAFSTNRGSPSSELWVMEASGTAPRRLLNLKGNCLQPAWSPRPKK